ncbi:hypothetical protein KSP40_PGU005317 [Platanthera guangdongensis]|uniref:Uncharacterized protein n=1 Tax=Platanthera guangdongensis TaxID=2320717 RepID=A0ABR2MZ29_9ASPA
MHSSNRNPFSKRSWLSCFGESSEILSMTYVVLKGYLYDPINCVRVTVATEPRKVNKKDISDPGSASPFICDELLAPVLHFVSVDRGERGLHGKRVAAQLLMRS